MEGVGGGVHDAEELHAPSVPEDGGGQDGSVRRRRAPVPVALAVLGLALVACGDDDAAGDDRDGDRERTTTTLPAPDRSVPEEPGDTQPLPGAAGVPDLVRELQPSVVAVLTDEGEGSGVVYAADGTVVTNAHVVEGADAVQVAFVDGERVDAEVEASDPRSDLAVLRVERDDLPVPSFATELPAVGELAVAMGNPLGFENTVTAGIISGLHRAIPGSAARAPALVDLVQTDAAISPGNSGGALIDAGGEVVGINVAYIPPGETGAVSIGFAIPSPTVVDVVEQLLETGEVRYPFLGITPQAITPEIAERLDLGTEEGVIVQSLVDGGPADDAAIEPGDVIVSLDGEPVRTVEEFLADLRGYDPGDGVAVEVLRDGDRRAVDVTLAERPNE
jgi:S1-C subfamily serine protease